MTERKTAGELATKAASDPTQYKAREVGQAIVEEGKIDESLRECIERHKNIFDEEEFCVGFVIASDPLIKGVMRRKFFAMLYLPSPRPDQAVFLYNKTLDKITKRLWVLPPAYSPNPNAWTMEKLYVSSWVPKGYEMMKGWSIAFYDGIFWEFIRAQHNITMLSEHEYLKANKEKLIKAGCKEGGPSGPEPFDFSKIKTNQVVNPQDVIAC